MKQVMYIIYRVPTNNYYLLVLLKGKRRFTFFSRQKKLKSKKKESKQEKGKSEDDAGSKMRDEGKKEKKEPKSKQEQKKKNRKKHRKNITALMIGLDAAGKTSILTIAKFPD